MLPHWSWEAISTFRAGLKNVLKDSNRSQEAQRSLSFLYVFFQEGDLWRPHQTQTKGLSVLVEALSSQISHLSLSLCRNSSPRFILQLFILLRLAGLNFVTTTFSLKKFCDLFVRLVSRFRNADGDEDGADGAEAGVQPEGSVEAHLVNHRGVR